MYRHLSNNYDAPYEQAHVGERPFDPGVVNCNNYDANGLLRACALPQSYPIFAYREAGASLLCSYRGGSQSHSPPYEQAHVGERPFDPGIIII